MIICYFCAQYSLDIGESVIIIKDKNNTIKVHKECYEDMIILLKERETKQVLEE